MQELRFVAVSEDGRYAVLAVPGRSARFTLPIDERLRAVALGQTSRLAQYEIEVESPLRPKEIQARIRAGETVEEIADAAGIAVERVRWFEGPVLAERAYIADQAQAASVRRPGESTPGPRLGEISAQRLTAVGADPDDAQWDARKRGDGNWQVLLTFTSGGRLHVAEWMFDPRRRHVIPVDDNAARMSLPDVELPAPPAPAPGQATVTRLEPRVRYEPQAAAQAAAGHSAPVHSGPAHSNTVHSAPSHPAPSHQVPAWPEPQPAAAPSPAAATFAAPIAQPVPAYQEPAGRPVTPQRAPMTPDFAPAATEEPAAITADADEEIAADRASAFADEPISVAAQHAPATAPQVRTDTESGIAGPAAVAQVADNAGRLASAAPAAAVAETAPAAAQLVAASTEPAASTQTAASTEPAASTQTAAGTQTAVDTEPAAEQDSQSAAPSKTAEAPSRAGRKNARGRRSSVPSWDEIMLGSSRQQD